MPWNHFPATRRLIALFVVGCALSLLGCDADHDRKLRSLAKRFEDKPTEKSLRKLLNFRSDGVYTYLQMALVGEAFGNHPDVFELVARDVRTSDEDRWLGKIDRLRERLFEYHSELAPNGTSFEGVVEGSYYNDLIQAARKDNRICRFPVDASPGFMGPSGADGNRSSSSPRLPT